MTNNERVGKALELLQAGLAPFVEREVQEAIQNKKLTAIKLNDFSTDPKYKHKPIAEWDVSGLLILMWDAWNDVFREVLGFQERSLVSELREWRNKWAHQEKFSSDDTYRVLDSIERLLTAISATQVDEVRSLRLDLQRRVYDEQLRNEKRKASASLISAGATDLKPWREVVTPHPDVASGKFQQAEFAADIWQVHIGQGSDEYRNPKEFFQRTYLTEGLKSLLTNAIERLAGRGGDPVVLLQTNFGGGKTHSLLSLYHLFAGSHVGEFAGVDELLKQTGPLPNQPVRRAVLVGNKISPGNPIIKTDGIQVRTLWGELAWQLGGKEAYEKIRLDDENATNPGDRLRELLQQYSPCLILIDEWVAYARQLHDAASLPGGSFETQFTFAQSLTEAASAVDSCLLVVSLPASDSAEADDSEVGGLRGRTALDRLRNVVGRVEASWRPASSEESFEIVRRRLFQPLSGEASFKHRDLTARAFVELYRAHNADFPDECRESEYERRIQAAYPVHPEIFDRLYKDWSTLISFQRTRGVLRLMATVIHALWEGGDKNPLILPSTLPLDNPRVHFELTRYLSDNWKPIIETDVDGADSLPVKMDGEVANLGKYQAARRVARTIFLGSAPTTGAAHRGLNDHLVKLGCAMPGESPAVFGDALRRLTENATYLYQDDTRYWYSTHPNLTRLAEDRAQQMASGQVVEELETRMRSVAVQRVEISRIHHFPSSGADVVDDRDARLVILSVNYPHVKGDNHSNAVNAASSILAMRGNTPRKFQNTLIFLAADKNKFEADLDHAIRMYLAWDSILKDKEVLNLDAQQIRQAETLKEKRETQVKALIPEVYQWLLSPHQDQPGSEVIWQISTLKKGDGNEPLVSRVVKTLKNEERLLFEFGAKTLRQQLDQVPLWRGDHVSIQQMIDDFAQYLHLPRLAGPGVLLKTISDGLANLTWQSDTFAYADHYDDATKQYVGLRAGERLTLRTDDPGLLVKPEIAAEQLSRERDVVSPPPTDMGEEQPPYLPSPYGPGVEPPQTGIKSSPRRYYGSVQIDPQRIGPDVTRIAQEVIAHLTGLLGAEAEITLEIQVRVPDGVPHDVVRTVLENGNTLKFTVQEFLEE